MDWSDERYVRVYTRDTPDWQCLSFLAQGLFCLILRKVDRAGVLPLGRSGRRVPGRRTHRAPPDGSSAGQPRVIFTGESTS